MSYYEPKEEHLTILKDDLFKRITTEELDKRIVREYESRKAIFLSMCSIWVEGNPSHIFVSSKSSTGKSYIAKACYDLFPDWLKTYRTKVSPEGFTYWHNAKYEPEWTWDGKLLYLEDCRQNLLRSDVFKVMLSEGSLATVVYKQRAIDIQINGRPVIALTTATGSPTDEVLNRFNLVECDESEAQTKEILKRQAQLAAEGADSRYSSDLQSALLCLKPIRVRVPFAQKINSHFPSSDVRVRRDFPRFLSLIQASCALHQYDRMKKEVDNLQYHYATGQDYENARESYKKMGVCTLLGITRTEREVYDGCRELYEKKLLDLGDADKQKTLDGNGWASAGFTAPEAMSHKPVLSQGKFYEALGRLVEKGLLSTEWVTNPESKRKNTLYVVNNYDGIKLPSYDSL